MTEERLKEIEEWARAWSRCDTTAGRVVVELVAEVRRLQAAALPDGAAVFPELSAQTAEAIRAQLMARHNGRKVHLMPAGCETVYVPPFRGVLNGITAETVYGVEV